MLYDLIVHSQTTTVELVDALITTNRTISNMGGPAGPKIPKRDGVNATHLTCWAAVESHTDLCAHDNYDKHTYHCKTFIHTLFF